MTKLFWLVCTIPEFPVTFTCVWDFFMCVRDDSLMCVWDDSYICILSFSAKEPLITRLFCGKWPIKISILTCVHNSRISCGIRVFVRWFVHVCEWWLVNVCVRWLMHILFDLFAQFQDFLLLLCVCDMTRSCVWEMTYSCVCAISHSCVGDESFLCVRDDSFMCVWDDSQTYIFDRCAQIQDLLSHTCICHNIFMCAYWLIHVCVMSHSCVCVILLSHMGWLRSVGSIKL